MAGSVASSNPAGAVRATRPGLAHEEAERPRLLFFYGRTSGLSRRVDAYLAQVLQRHKNHSTFRLTRVAVEDHQDLAERFGITEVPTLLVIEGSEAKARLEAPRDRASIELALSPWLL